MNKSILAVCLLIVIFVFSGCGVTTLAPTPTLTPKPTAIPKPTSTPTTTAIPTPTPTPTPTPSPQKLELTESFKTKEIIYNNMLKRLSTEMTGSSYQDKKVLSEVQNGCRVQGEHIDKIISDSSLTDTSMTGQAYHNLKEAFDYLSMACISGKWYYDNGKDGDLEAMKYSLEDSKEYFRKYKDLFK